MSVNNDVMEKTVALLNEEKLSALVAISDGTNEFLAPHGVFVLSGIRPIGESCVIVTASGQSTLIVTPKWELKRAKRLSRTQTTLSADTLVDGIAQALRANTIDGSGVIAVGLSNLGHVQAERITAALGGKVKARDRLFRDLAGVRSSEELKAAERAMQIAERGYARLLEITRPGMREHEVVADLYCYMKDLGAEDNFLLTSASQHHRGIQAGGGRVIEIGDLILSEITPCVSGQFVQTCRTISVGEPLPVVVEKFEILKTAYLKGLEEAKHGAVVAEATQRVDDVFRKHGYGDYCRPPYMRVRGHPVGITSDAPGNMTIDNEAVFKEGMMFCLQPNQYLPETGYLMAGDTVVVGRSGARSLCSHMPELGVIRV